ncbi:MAG: hypothetical protein KUG77_19540 [Nannocystaceae bacterium]|nr:hypothetical protein [Nannocystaceae bacterium]
MNRPTSLLAASLPMLVALACSPDDAPADETGTTGSASDTTPAPTPNAGSTSVTAATTPTDSGGPSDTSPTSGGGSESTAQSTGTQSTGAEGTGDEETGSASSGSTSGLTGGEDASSGTSSGAQDNEAPVILLLSASPSTLEGEGIVVVTAIVTDPDGIADLIGGVITTPEGAAYGALASTADEGSYEIELSWNEFNEVQSIDIPPQESTARDLHVEFFDQAGASVDAMIAVTLEATVDGFAVCDGASVSWQSDTNCGACGFSCLDPPGPGFNSICLNEFPTDDSGCFGEAFVTVFNSATTCSAACADAAGPFANETGVLGCQYQNVGIGCGDVHPADCPGTSVDSPPFGCTPQADSILQCDCEAVYLPLSLIHI